MTAFYSHLTLIVGGIVVLAACEEERPPRSTSDFLENPIMLEAAMVRCSEDRAATRYDAECVNARQAVKQIEAKEEAARQAVLDAESERKRQAWRRTQEAAEEARQRAAEAERLREEAEYLAQFGVAPPQEVSSADDETELGNTPLVVIPESSEQLPLSAAPGGVVPATDGGNAPVGEVQTEEDDALEEGGN